MGEGCCRGVTGGRDSLDPQQRGSCSPGTHLPLRPHTRQPTWSSGLALNPRHAWPLALLHLPPRALALQAPTSCSLVLGPAHAADQALHCLPVSGLDSPRAAAGLPSLCTALGLLRHLGPALGSPRPPRKGFSTSSQVHDGCYELNCDSHPNSYMEVLAPQDLRTWLCLETGPTKRRLEYNEVNRVGPNPIRLVALQAEGIKTRTPRGKARGRRREKAAICGVRREAAGETAPLTVSPGLPASSTEKQVSVDLALQPVAGPPKQTHTGDWLCVPLTASVSPVRNGDAVPGEEDGLGLRGFCAQG